MIDRITLKTKGKAAFRRNYWPCFLAAIVLGIAEGTAGTNSSVRSGEDLGNQVASLSYYELMSVLMLILCAAVVVLLIAAFLLGPLQVGCQRFFLVNTLQNAELSELKFGFQNNYKGMVKTMFLKDLFIALWSLLLVVPGVIKMYQWRLVPYILSEKPDMDTKEALNLSKEMMEGNKMDAFVYDLSFIGWYILTAFTWGLLGIFYVYPYKYCSDAELYLSIRSFHSLENAETVEYTTDTTESSAENFTYGNWNDAESADSEETAQTIDVDEVETTEYTSIYDAPETKNDDSIDNPFEK